MILIACGLIREANILRGLGVIAIPGGGDAKRLEAILDAQASTATMIVSAGIAGALDPGLKAGDVVIDLSPHSREGRNPESQAGSPATLGPHVRGGIWDGSLKAVLPHANFGSIIGQDRIAATAAEKVALHAATGALAVDMESHIAARVAARHGLPFLAIRTISDSAQDTLPPAALVGMSPDGSMALGKVLTSLARRPGQLPALIKTGQNAEAAFRALRQVSQAIATLERL
ncbi:MULTISPECIES: phosphorylase [unclassified Sphingomonas]|uniref:phosphorylase family protein n=1 Tax=unclassified Sphingomonas TaxID=196159 RepID=UPI000BCCBA21|nr:MAG: hypothetical protein B7Z43_11195 [Sphingomonas sp. 12-62-6]OYX36853.1 MAG: hypothetical protein B7Y98_14495 [Sphingomonas sp. 32-62-10]